MWLQIKIKEVRHLPYLEATNKVANAAYVLKALKSNLDALKVTNNK